MSAVSALDYLSFGLCLIYKRGGDFKNTLKIGPKMSLSTFATSFPCQHIKLDPILWGNTHTAFYESGSL